eukprot:Pgem_evm1s5298
MYNPADRDSPWVYENNVGYTRFTLDTQNHGCFQNAARSSVGDLRWTCNGNYYAYNDQVYLRRQIDGVKAWFDNFELTYPNYKKPHREIVIWYMGSNNTTPFDP